MYKPTNYGGMFTTERFLIFDRPQYNKKMRRHLGISHLPIRIVTVAKGYLGNKFIVRTRAIIHQQVEPDGQHLRFAVEGGKWYRVPIN